MSTAALTLMVNEQLILQGEAVFGDGTSQACTAPSWTANVGTYISLLPVTNNPNQVLVQALAVGWTTVTLTANSLTQTFVIDVVANAATSLVISEAQVPPQYQYDPDRNRGRGLGKGYQP